MASALPLRPSVDHDPRPTSVYDLTGKDSGSVLESLACETAREILSTLADAPATASEIADDVDTSIQNTDYHLSKLQEAGMVEQVGTWYSSKGREMSVYDITSQEIQLRIGSDNTVPTVESA